VSDIAIKPSHKGLLHRALGLKQGEKIPTSRLQSAAHSSDPTLRKRAQFALNAKKFHHAKSSKRADGRASRLYGAKS